MLSQRSSGLLLLCLVASSLVASTMAATMDGVEEERKFASEPNNKMKPGHPSMNFAPESETRQELFSLVVTLLDSLRTSFSQRSLEARSLGTSNPMANAGIAATTMIKTYLRSYSTDDDLCMQKFLCQANQNCVESVGDSGYLFCQIGTYGMSYMLERQTDTPFEIFNDAGRRGRVALGDECIKIFEECNIQ